MYTLRLEKKILVFIVTYNKIDNIYKLISCIKNYSSDLHLLIIDDNSPDYTSDIIEETQSVFKNIF